MIGNKAPMCNNVYNDVYSRMYAEIRKERLPETSEFFLEILRRNEILSPDRLLDVCSGTGIDLRFFAERGYLVDGVDASEEAVAIAKRESPMNVIVVCDAESLTSRIKHSYDAVYVIQSFHLLSDPGRALQEISKVVRSGGLLAFDFRNIDAPETEGSFEETIAGLHRVEERKVSGNKILIRYEYDSGESVLHTVRMFSLWEINSMLRFDYDIVDFYGGYEFRTPHWRSDKYVVVVARRK